MTDRPILFSAPMIRALLAGRKTQTRRIIKPQPEQFPNGKWHVFNRHGGCIASDEDDVRTAAVDYLRIEVEDRLWVREAWRAWCEYDKVSPSLIPTGADIQFVADNPLSPWDTRLRPGMFMPRWASRLTLNVAGVRVERLQNISASDAEAEGVFRHVSVYSLDKIYRGERAETAIKYYRELWESINGIGSWEQNPWIAVYEFSVEHRNIAAPSPLVRESEEAGR